MTTKPLAPSTAWISASIFHLHLLFPGFFEERGDAGIHVGGPITFYPAAAGGAHHPQVLQTHWLTLLQVSEAAVGQHLHRDTLQLTHLKQKLC